MQSLKSFRKYISTSLDLEQNETAYKFFVKIVKVFDLGFKQDRTIQLTSLFRLLLGFTGAVANSIMWYKLPSPARLKYEPWFRHMLELYFISI
ncbi:hypothetical protein BU23DRAFT_555903, partial [Bimuria novae-zelandiae CBS 107.79]